MHLSPLFQVFFIDHNSHCTTFIDPRLPVEVTDPTASLLQAPNRGRMRSRSEGEGIIDGGQDAGLASVSRKNEVVSRQFGLGLCP